MILLLALLALSLTAAPVCEADAGMPYDVGPEDIGMGVRFSERGLEKFCQMGFTLFPMVASSLPPFNISNVDITIGTLTVTNLRIRSLEMNVFKLRFLNDGMFRIDASDGLLTLSMDLSAKIFGLTGTLQALFSLTGLSGFVQFLLQEDSQCRYHFSPVEPLAAKGMNFERFEMDLVGTNSLGSTLASLLGSNKNQLETSLRSSILPLFLDTILNLFVTMLRTDGTRVPAINNQGITDVRYIGTILINESKAVADWPGYTYFYNQTAGKVDGEFYNEKPLSPMRSLYTSADFELVLDRNTINSLLYVLHNNDNRFAEQDVSVPSDVTADVGGTGVEVTKITVNTTREPEIIAFYGAMAETRFWIEYTLTLNTSEVVSGHAQLSVRTSFKTTQRARTLFVNHLVVSPVLLNITEITLQDSSVGSGTKVDNTHLIQLLQATLEKTIFPLYNEMMYEGGINLMNGNFLKYDEIFHIFFPSEDKVVFIAEVNRNPIYV